MNRPTMKLTLAAGGDSVGATIANLEGEVNRTLGVVYDDLNSLDSKADEKAGKSDLIAEANARNALAGAISDQLGGDAIDIRNAIAGEDGYVDIFLTGDRDDPARARLFALSKVTGLLSLGALDAQTLRATALDLYGAGIAVPLVKPGEDQVLDIVALRMLDESRSRALGIHVRTGEVDLGPLTPKSLASLRADLGIGAGASALGRASVADTILLIWQSGQSLSLGSRAVLADPPMLSTSPYTPYGFMLNTGLRGAGGDSLDASKIVDFVPAQDHYSEGGQGQVPGSSMMAQLARLNADNGTLKDMVWRGHGRGGTSIVDLQQNSQSFQNGVVELQKTIAIAAGYGRDVRLPAVMWTQGEQDRALTKEVYKAELVKLRNSYNAAYLPLLPDGHPDIALIIDQVSASTTAGPGTPAAIAQYEAMRDIPGFYMSCAKYWAELVDTVHLEPRSTALLGEYQARAHNQIVGLGNTGFRPTMPQNIVRNGRIITLTLRTPYGHSIEVDTTTLPAQANLGFEYSGANIVSAALADAAARTITITLDAEAGGTLAYAYTSTGTGYGSRPGAWGNIRDTDPARSVTVPGATLPNWLVAFQEPVA